MTTTKTYVYIGTATECFKVQFPHPIKRGVPFPVDEFFDDLFAGDPLYVEVREDHAKAILETLADAGPDPGAHIEAVQEVLAALEPARAEKDARMMKARLAFQAAQPPLTDLDLREG
jgi:hypothetical protein